MSTAPTGAPLIAGVIDRFAKQISHGSVFLRSAEEIERVPRLGALLKAYGEPGSGLGLQHDGLYYWAPTEGGTEVDFLVQRGKDFTAIEVKARESLSSHDFKGLKAIAALKGIRRRVVVFLGDRPFRTEDGIEALPVRDFLHELEGRTI